MPLSESEASLQLSSIEEYSICKVIFHNDIVSFEEIRKASTNDAILARVRRYVSQGWPETVEDDLLPYYRRKTELSTEKESLFWGSRIVIPELFRERVLTILHEGHPGMVKMKSMARSYVWWPMIDTDIENFVKRCNPCQLSQARPPKSSIHHWDTPAMPWHRIHLDYKGPVKGKMFLVVIDSYSKWMEIFPTNSTTSAVTIRFLKSLFVQFGLPHTIVTDNATNFTSDGVHRFLQDTRNSTQKSGSVPPCQ